MKTIDITDEMIDAACNAVVPEMYRVDAMRVLEAVVKLAIEKGLPISDNGDKQIYLSQHSSKEASEAAQDDHINDAVDMVAQLRNELTATRKDLRTYMNAANAEAMFADELKAELDQLRAAQPVQEPAGHFIWHQGSWMQQTGENLSGTTPLYLAAPAQPCRDDVLEEAAQIAMAHNYTGGGLDAAKKIRALRTQPAEPTDKKYLTVAPSVPAQAVTITDADKRTLIRVVECAEILNKRPHPMCRDCADEDGTCPHDGLECDMRKLLSDARRLLSGSAKTGEAG